ncbi:signal peptide peptidase SppA [Sulfurihydrogenibium subterraneum]|uniref:signal peptide peptidase SppA n=1 Tax=Sulfurihydrogenibium subterraneum TaxID=171121 RepID=UPI000491EAC0|nr:signal peptide peptidase SppA [Sulfurihydrogenibium subterraneum]
MLKKFLIGLVGVFIAFYIISSIREASKPKVALIRVNDTIMDHMETVSNISQAEKEDSIKAVVIAVDSPGGAVGASQEIYRAIEKLREKKPVVVSMGNVAASGGYYISAPANVIYANPGTITGSIGVIIQQVDLSEILNKIGVKVNTVKSGENKDILYPTKPLTPEQRQILEKTVMDVYDQFLDAIVKYRPIKKEVLKTYADGRVFSGREAQKIGLVDKLGNIQDAVREARKLGKLPEDAPVVEIKPPKPLLEELLKSKFGIFIEKPKTGIYYLMSF